MRDVHAAELDNDGMREEEERRLCGSSERLTTVPLWVFFAEKLYLEKRDNYLLENMTRRLGIVVNRFGASCSLE